MKRWQILENDQDFDLQLTLRGIAGRELVSIFCDGSVSFECNDISLDDKETEETLEFLNYMMEEV